MSNTVRLDELTREEVRARAPGATVILPVSSTEQHGPHLPLNVDRIQGEALTLRAAEIAAASVPVLVAPILPYGLSGLHLHLCALTLSSTTFLGVLNDLGDSLVAAGFKRIFVLNCHGGNDECVKLMARDMVVRHEVAVAACSYWEVAEPALEDAVLGKLARHSIDHAGPVETSMMMALAPGLVHTDLVPATDPQPPRISRRGMPRGLAVHKTGEWERLGGYSDGAANASAEWGNLILDLVSKAVAEAVVAFHRAAY